MLFLRLLARWALLHLVAEEERPQPRGKPPNDYTLAEVAALPSGSGPLLSIALRHEDPDVAALAAERVEEKFVMLIAHYQEANIIARMTAVRRLKANQDFLVEIAIRDDDAGLALFAAHLVASKEHTRRLLKSKYESVRMIAVMRETEPKCLERLLTTDPSPGIRERAGKQLRVLYAN